MKCKHCEGPIIGRGLDKAKFCCERCKWTWNNKNRVLKPNVHYDCIVCGKHVDRYVAPSSFCNNTFEFCSRTCKGKYQVGDKHPLWKGGTFSDGKGYRKVHAKNHPFADNHGAIFEHRHIMEQSIGRLLNKSEVVHHINDNPSDNRIENLMLFKNQAEHKKFHEQRDGVKIRDKKNGRYIERKKNGNK